MHRRFVEDHVFVEISAVYAAVVYAAGLPACCAAELPACCAAGFAGGRYLRMSLTDTTGN